MALTEDRKVGFFHFPYLFLTSFSPCLLNFSFLELAQNSPSSGFAPGVQGDFIQLHYPCEHSKFPVSLWLLQSSRLWVCATQNKYAWTVSSFGSEAIVVGFLIFFCLFF